MKKIVKLKESDLTKLVGRIINEIRKDNPYDNLKNFLEDSIDFSGYTLKNRYKNKFTQLYEIFLSEYEYYVERYGEKRAMIEWLRGVPSSIDIPIYLNDVTNLLYALGFDDVKGMEDDDLDKFYYSIVADTIIDNK